MRKGVFQTLSIECFNIISSVFQGIWRPRSQQNLILGNFFSKILCSLVVVPVILLLVLFGVMYGLLIVSDLFVHLTNTFVKVIQKYRKRLSEKAKEGPLEAVYSA